MADAEAVSFGLPKRSDVTYIGLVLNKRGALRAIESGLPELGAVCAASDGFATRNQGMTADESLSMCCEVIKLARCRSAARRFRFPPPSGCPFDGEVDPARVVEMARNNAAAWGRSRWRLRIPSASPGRVMWRIWWPAWLRPSIHCRCACTFTTRATPDLRMCGRQSVRWRKWRMRAWAAWAVVLSQLRAAGNVPTEDVVYMLERSGVRTGFEYRSLDRSIQLACRRDGQGSARHAEPRREFPRQAFQR